MKPRFKVRSRSRGVIGYVIAAIVVVAIACGGFWLFSSVALTAAPTPLLLQSPGSGQEWFGQRLKERFPVASSEADLIRELWLEGFLPRTNLRAERRTAEFESQKELFRKCRLTATVSWTADEKGQVTGVDGAYSDACP